MEPGIVPLRLAIHHEGSTRTSSRPEQQVLYEGVLVHPTGSHMFERQTVGVTRGVEQHVPEFDVTAKVHISVSGGKTQQQLFETVERRVSPSSEYDKNTAAG